MVVALYKNSSLHIHLVGKFEVMRFSRPVVSFINSFFDNTLPSGLRGLKDQLEKSNYKDFKLNS